MKTNLKEHLYGTFGRPKVPQKPPGKDLFGRALRLLDEVKTKIYQGHALYHNIIGVFLTPARRRIPIATTCLTTPRPDRLRE